MRRPSIVALVGAVALGVWGNSVLATNVPVLNPSFESPVIDTNPASPTYNPFGAVPFVDSWNQLTPPATSNTSGVFANSPPGHLNFLSLPDHIDNMDGNQGAFLSGATGVGLTQLLSGAPNTYVPGHSYNFTVGVCISASFAPAVDDQLQLVLYYMDGVTPVAISTNTFTDAGLTATHLVDYNVSTGPVGGGDAWANQQIGIEILSSGSATGYWDVDNAVVSEVPEPASLAVFGCGVGALALRRRRAAIR